LTAVHAAGAEHPPGGAYDADIIILSYGRPRETIAAIASAVGQCGIRKHVTVLDQGSEPDDLAQIADFVGSRPDVTLLAQPANAGVAAGRNRASAFGHGEVIVGLDNDAVFADSCVVARAVQRFREKPSLAAIGFRILLASNETDDVLSWGYPRALLGQAGRSFDTTTFVGAGHAIRRAAWDQVGGYDEALFFCWEEKDFCARAIASGWRVRYCGDLVIHHDVSPERRLKWREGRWFHFVRNRLYLARKHETPARVLLLACGYALKGARNRLLCQTARAFWAAGRMPIAARPARSRAVPDEVGFLQRLRSDVFARLPGA
jgi:GT2 family glycosyltransferase